MIVVALGIPPLMELIELVEHCFEEFLVAGSFIHVHGSPGGYGRFGIAPVIVFLVVADEVGYHAVVGLIVEEGNHFAFGYLLVEMYVARSNLPGVPRPDAVDESVVRRVAAAMQDVTGRGAVVAVQGHHCFYEYLAVFVVLEVLAVSAQQRSDLCVPLLFVLFKAIVYIQRCYGSQFFGCVFTAQRQGLSHLRLISLAGFQGHFTLFCDVQAIAPHSLNLVCCEESDYRVRGIFGADERETFIYAAYDRGRLVYASVPVEADLYRFLAHILHD